jgi:hypothetical protein
MIRNSKTIQRVAAVIGGSMIVAVAFTNTASGQAAYTTVAAPVTAQVAGVTVAQTTAAPSTVVAVAQSPTTAGTEVLGVQEEAGEVALTGTNSGTYTAAGIALTAAGAVLIGATRRRRTQK